jgi:O-antigen/teichoic acid export membrane protein
MFFSMGVSLFTYRIVLQNLGVDNYGIYTVVGGFVTLFAFFNGPLNAAALRFFAFEIGKGRSDNLKTVFRSALFTHLFYGVVAVVLLEVLGLWLFKNKLVIPPERMSAAVWLFHFSVVGVFVTIVQTPLTALIIATERMKVYAYLGIVDVVVKLGVAMAVVFTKGDKLVLYAFLLMLSTIGIFLIYHFYCSRNIKDGYSFRPVVNWKLQREMMGFVGWSLVGNVAWILKTQGISILLNIFFGIAVNAAFGIANMISTAFNQFSQKFSTAIKPQIIKRYASNNIGEMTSLIARGAKFSFFLLFLITLPVLLQTEYLLNIWLTEIPKHSVIFTKLLIINSLINSFTNVFDIVISATGKIMEYHLVISGMLLFYVPVSYLFLKSGYQPVVVFYVSILFYSVAALLKIIIVKIKIPQFSAWNFVFSVLGVSVIVAALSFIPPLVIKRYLTETWVSFFIVSIVCLMSTFLCVMFVGLTKQEKNWFYARLKILLKRTAFEMVENVK